MSSEETPSDGPAEGRNGTGAGRSDVPNDEPESDENPPDVEISASVSAREVTFRRVPDVETTFDPDGEHSVDSGRENLPDRVEPGVTHRGVRAFYRAVSRLSPRRGDGSSGSADA